MCFSPFQLVVLAFLGDLSSNNDMAQALIIKELSNRLLPKMYHLSRESHNHLWRS